MSIGIGCGRAGGPVVPGAHERVLEDGELIVLVAEVIEQAQDEPLGDAAAADGCRAGDGRAQLVAGHARHEVEAVVDRLGQAGEVHAVADEVGAHGDHDVDGQVFLLGGLEQKLDEGDRGVPGVFDLVVAAEAEELFELVDDDEEIVLCDASPAGRPRPGRGCRVAAWLRAGRCWWSRARRWRRGRRREFRAAARFLIGSSPGRMIAIRQAGLVLTMKPP